MKYVKMLGLLAVAAAALMAFTGVASAAQVTSPQGEPYTGEIHASAGLTELHGEAFSVACKTSTVAGTIETEAHGPITTLDFSECNFPVTVKTNGTLKADPTSGGNATLTSTGAEITIDGPFGINCIYKTSGTAVGTLTGSSSTGATAKLDIESSLIPRTGHSPFCGVAGEWTGSYTVTSPDYLDVD